MRKFIIFDSFSILMVVLSILMPIETSAQVSIVRPIDIASRFKSGTVHIQISPTYSGDTLKPFDGDQFNALEMPGSDSLVVTVQFDSLVQIERSVVFFWMSGNWTLEVADSLSDMEGKTGTYSKIVEGKPFSAFMWDSASFQQKLIKVIRLSVKNPSSSLVILGEWTLKGALTFNRLVMLPYPIFVIPGRSLHLNVKMLDEQNNIYPYLLSEPLQWVTSDPSVAIVDEYGKLTGIRSGSTMLTVSTASKTISGTATVNVVSDFRPQKAPPLNVKVALVIEDPVIPVQGYQRIHEIFHWRDPVLLIKDLVFHFLEASDSVVNFQIVETQNDNKLFTHYWDTVLTANRYYQLLSEPGWTSLKTAADSGKLWFDYREMVKYYQFDQKRNDGQIDEVWVYAGPYLAMYESQLMGPGAFWWNSPPIKDGTALKRLLSVMGLNYERGVDLAFHSFGHRVESAITQAYLQTQGRSWNPKSANPTPWDLFTRIDKDLPGQAQVGNIHFPPNGTHDYDYGNPTYVMSYAENWYRYPYLFDQSAQVNVNTWIYKTPEYPNGDPLAEGQDQLGYLRWWYDHLPRYVGATDGVLNNWWHYAVDYEGAVELAKKTPVLGVNESGNCVPRLATLEQNYPNPFNPTTNIEFTIAHPGFVSLKVYDVLGREVATLVNQNLSPGVHIVKWVANNVSSGVYFYRLQVGSLLETRKLVILK